MCKRKSHALWLYAFSCSPRKTEAEASINLSPVWSQNKFSPPPPPKKKKQKNQNKPIMVAHTCKLMM
jgi:hypothetical protein